MGSNTNAISITRKKDFSAWYHEVIAAADLADRSSVRGCMVIKPWGYAIWENMQRVLDAKFKELGVMNCYFPMFTPIDLFAKEASHISGFAKEMAVVTHSRIENIDGKLVPTSPIETPLAVRPTSEMIIGESFARWVESYRDLPLLVNQWCNVVRWEMRTRMFLRTTEFLWQEGHTAHETETEAVVLAKKIHELYNWFITDVLKIYAIMGEKPDHEKFPGAVTTYTMEAMMQDGKALQCATSHYLGTNFAKAVEIKFQSRNGGLDFAHTTSWGITTRMIGGLIMAHGDDNGINTPLEVAPYHIVIIPIIKNERSRAEILEYCEKIKISCSSHRVLIDIKDTSSQNKRWDYIRKGVPIICEIGERDINGRSIAFTRRQPKILKDSCEFDAFSHVVNQILEEHDAALYSKSVELNTSKTEKNIKNFEEMKEFFSNEMPGFVMAKWSGNGLSLLDKIGVSIRCTPVKSEKSDGKCILTGEKADTDYIFARSY
ncbi:MAG: proline--tRNA ligase [Holosporales bacterium]|jgi:prolyl-tRNA synthetase|nr:proline--tRNA ligase [Holosporales bacterium]